MVCLVLLTITLFAATLAHVSSLSVGDRVEGRPSWHMPPPERQGSRAQDGSDLAAVGDAHLGDPGHDPHAELLGGPLLAAGAVDECLDDLLEAVLLGAVGALVEVARDGHGRGGIQFLVEVVVDPRQGIAARAGRGASGRALAHDPPPSGTR